MSRIAGVLFDKDGVLIDFQATWGPASARGIRALARDETQARALAGAIDFDLEAERYAPASVFIAGSAEESMAAWAAATGEDRAFLERISARIVEEGAALAATLPDALPALRALRGMGLPLGIATNDSEASARAQMAALGLTDLFETINGADSGHGAKPGPGMILAFAAHLGVGPERIVMVGDSTHDLHAARAAGAIRVGIGTGPASLDDLAPHADHVVVTMAELPDLVARLGG